MFKPLLRRGRKIIPAKLFLFLFILLLYFMIRTFYSSSRALDNIPNDRIIFNLRALNHSIPNFIAEETYGPVNRKNSKIIFRQEIEKPRLVVASQDLNQSSIEKQVLPIGDFETVGQRNVEVNPVYEEIIKSEEEAVIPGLGEDGEAVTDIPYVSPQEIDAIMKKEAFNKLLSDRISLTRTLPDARHYLCAEQTFNDNLPTASVIIIFINEAWSTLLRTVHSTLLRSPEKYLKEIILVDDFSNKDELNGKLNYYISTRLPSKVKLLRLKKRHGLIRARLAGAKVTSGDVLVFLDSHCECVVGWLEPLLQRIKEQRSAVVCPIIDVINDRNLGYMYSADSSFQVGGFTWSGHFTWIPVPDFEEKRKTSPIASTRSPTMAGGLFAIDRNYFWEIGSYDREMDVWGGENLEMSFRIWQCGGTLEIVPCSRVGHIFRSFHPYSFPGRKDTHGINTARMAEVWMDDYKRLFYLHRPDLKKKEIGSVKARLELRKNLKCNSFEWFLKNVIPQKFILDEGVQAYGRVKSMTRNICLDNLNSPEDSAGKIGLYNCHNMLFPSQYFSLSEKGELRREELCAEVELRNFVIPGLIIGGKGNVTMVECNDSPKQIWKFKNNLLIHKFTGYCIHAYGAYPESLVTVTDCRRHDLNFKWNWEFVRQENGTYKKYLI